MSKQFSCCLNYNQFTKSFDITSKVCGVLIAPALVLSTAATNVLFVVVVLFGLMAGNLKAKFYHIVRNPVAIVFLAFYGLFLVGSLYSKAPWSDILLVLRKYDKFLFAVLLLPLFAEERWRRYAIHAYLIAIFISLVSSYLLELNWMSFGVIKGSIEVFRPSIEYNLLMAFAAYLLMYKVVSEKSFRWLWLSLLALVVHTVLFRSVGRVGYVVFAVLMVLFFVQKFGVRGIILAMISFVLLYGSAYKFSKTFKGRSNQALQNVQIYEQKSMTSVGERIKFVKNGISIIKKYYFVGSGTGSFKQQYFLNYATSKFLTTNPHNEYVYIVVQFGLIGLLFLFCLFSVPLWYSTMLSLEMQYVVVGTVFGIAVGCLANSWLLDTTTGHFYVYFLAVACAEWKGVKT